MPSGRGDLGFFSGFSAALFFLLFAGAVAAAIRRRWRLAAERREEVRRLAWLAAAEAARAEMEAAALAYVAPPIEDGKISGGGVGEVGLPPPLPLPQCAVCYRLTTTRCSRCKAVRYCSGKCQIIHWRQGHKDECHPPRIDDHYTDQESVSNLKGLRTDQSDLCENSVEIEGKAHFKPAETFPVRPSSESNFSSAVFSEDDSREVKPFVETSGTERTSDSFADSSSSSSCSTFSRPPEASDDTSASEEPHELRCARVGKASCHDISHDGLRTAVNTSEANLTGVPLSEFARASLSVNNLPCASNFEQQVSSSKAEDVECSSSGPSGSSFIGSDNCTNARSSEDAGECEGDHVQMAAGSSSEISSNLSPSETSSAKEDSSYRTVSSEGTAQSNSRYLTALGSDKSGSVASGRSNNVWLLKSKSSRPLSSFSSVNHEFSSGGRQSISLDTSSKIDNAPPLHTKLSERTGLVPNGISDLKTSVRRVVQQLKSSQLSKHQSSGSSSDISRKYKMLFPYDLFIKLYNCDKVELRPCGLTNCGSSCYANAVLQCLAFTRPLTSYLLQGFHTKTCREGDWCFTCEFGSLLVKANKGESPLSPIGILSHIHNIGSNLGHGKEEDAHEFLRYVIDTMQSVCLKEAGANVAGTLAEETTLIQLIFGGYLCSKIKCMRCWGKSEQHERMMDLTVEIQGDIGTLEEALTRFTATEILDGENKYHCSRCKSYERAKKKLTVLQAPNVLTIALKRFQSGKFGKLNKAVRFPEHLNLAPYMSGTDDKSPVYALYAVVVHQDIMNAAFSGHYVCYVKSTQGKWYKTDDSKVMPVEIGRVLTKNAYMLLYARCPPRAPGLIRSSMSHNHLKTNQRNRCKDTLLSGHGPSVSLPRSEGSPPCGPYDNHSTSFRPSYLFNERLPFPKAESSSDSSSLLSCSDEGSWSTESTRDSTSTEEFSDCIFGDSGRFIRNNSLRFSEDSDGFVRSPLIPRHSYAGEDEALSFGERLGWERREDVGLEGRDGPLFLYSDTSNQCRKLTEECRGRETDSGVVGLNEGKSSVLMRRSSTARERRTQTFY